MFYVVGTPIGNLGDLSKRVIDTLSNVDIIFAEDTRTALSLLNSQNIKKQVKSCHKDNEKNNINEIISLHNKGLNIALISEAGMPCVSDPGAIIVKELIENNIPFEIVQGPTALIHGLIASGFSGSHFYFHGFLPHKPKDKEKEALSLKNISAPIIFYESPHRIKDTLEILLDIFPAPISVTREATKKFEETVFIHNKDDIKSLTIKGEFVIVVDNRYHHEESISNSTACIDYNKTVKELHKEGFTHKDILKVLKTLGMKRNEAYDLINTLLG